MVEELQPGESSRMVREHPLPGQLHPGPSPVGELPQGRASETMGRFWNLRTKLTGVLLLVFTGTYLLQSAIHAVNERQLISELEEATVDIANEAKRLVESSLQEWGRPRTAVPDFDLVRESTGSAAPSADSGASSIARSPRLVPNRIRIKLRLTRPGIPDTVGEEGPGLGEAAGTRVTTVPDLPQEIQRILETAMERGSGGGPRMTTLHASPLPNGTFPFVQRSPPPPPAVSVIDLTPYFDRIENIVSEAEQQDRLATFAVFLVGIALAWFLGLRVTRPVDDVVQGFQRLAEGDFDVKVEERPGAEFAHLGQRFNEMVGRLREGRDLEKELSQRERVRHMGDLAAGVAHDIRNPLNAIRLNVGQIRDEFLPADERGQARFLRFTADVQGEVERLNDLVTNFLSLAQPAAESAEAISPNELVEELYRLLEKEARGKRVALVLDLQDDLPQQVWNRQEMKSAFLNIALNALQAQSDAGGRLEIRTREEDGPDGRELVIRFQDAGPGVPEENRERIFIPYFTTRKGGTGLGMAISRRTAERHGGTLELETSSAPGACFEFRFRQEPVDRAGEAGA